MRDLEKQAGIFGDPVEITQEQYERIKVNVEREMSGERQAYQDSKAALSDIPHDRENIFQHELANAEQPRLKEFVIPLLTRYNEANNCKVFSLEHMAKAGIPDARLERYRKGGIPKDSISGYVTQFWAHYILV